MSKPQYGKARWARYEYLRSNHFKKDEARELSRIEPVVVNGKKRADPVIRNLVYQRRQLYSQFRKATAGRGLSEGQESYRWYRGLRDWYKDYGFVTKGKQIRKGEVVEAPSRPLVWSWFRATETRLAKRWSHTKQGIEAARAWAASNGKDPSQYSETALLRDYRRRKRTTKPPIKFNVRTMKRRARIRAKAIKEADMVHRGITPRKQPLERLKETLRVSLGMQEPAKGWTAEQKRNRRAYHVHLRMSIKHAEAEQAAGRKAVG